MPRHRCFVVLWCIGNPRPQLCKTTKEASVLGAFIRDQSSVVSPSVSPLCTSIPPSLPGPHPPWETHKSAYLQKPSRHAHSFDGSIRGATAFAKVWTRRESNPRPNGETTCFLHAYLRFDFRTPARPKLPTDALSPLSFTGCTGLHPAIPDLSAPPVQVAPGR